MQNRDLFPSAELFDLYMPVRAVVSNPAIDKAFLEFEAAASLAKWRYHFFGRFGIWLIVTGTIYAIGEHTALMEFLSALPIWILNALNFGMVLSGCIGLSIHVVLFTTKCKKTWLTNRFAAERVRSISFQAYPLTCKAADSVDLEKMVATFYREQIAHLRMELNASRTALVLFNPRTAVAKLEIPAKPVNAELAAKGISAYMELRIEYQRFFAASEIEKIGNSQRFNYTAADLLYVTGSTATVVTLAATTWYVLPGAMLAWVGFMAISAFILGLSKSILDNASLADTSKARYENYLQSIDECRDDLQNSHASLSDVVKRVERVVLDELSLFGQESDRISYRM